MHCISIFSNNVIILHKVYLISTLDKTSNNYTLLVNLGEFAYLFVYVAVDYTSVIKDVVSISISQLPKYILQQETRDEI